MLNPTNNQLFGEAIQNVPILLNYSFGNREDKTIQNIQQLSSLFSPYGIAGKTIINGQWALMQPFEDCLTFSFSGNSLDILATIPSTGGLKSGGITTGQICSLKSFQPGLTGFQSYAFDIRLKFNKSQGMWPAIWFYTQTPGLDDGSEIDLMEFFMMTNQNQLDWTGFNHGPGVGSDIYSLNLNQWQIWHPGIDFSSEMFSYQLIWTPTAVHKYFCGTLIRATNFKWTSKGSPQLLISNQVGGDSTKLPGLAPQTVNQFPATMSIESIKIYGA